MVLTLTWVAAFVLKANPALFVGAATVSTVLFVIAIVWTLLILVAFLLAIAGAR